MCSLCVLNELLALFSLHHILYIIFNVFLYSFVVFLVNDKIK